MKVETIDKVVGRKLSGGSLPDIDTDFEGARRNEIKEYMEQRFGETQVVSVGTVTTFQLRGALKAFDRQNQNDVYHSNLITSMISAKDTTMLDLYRRATVEPKLREYIENNSDFFYQIPTILNQPVSKSIHACAVLIMPKIMEGDSWIPVRQQGDLIVSEWDGYELDNAGFLKEDILGIKQLDKFSDIISLIKKNGKEVPDIYNLPYNEEVYRFFGNGWNGDIFQFGSTSMSKYISNMKPQQIDDLIAANALYRPGPMENHYHEIYIQCKNEGRDVEYLWGTENITKDTFGMIVYQEQVMKVCQELGGLSLLEADDVRRAMGKKNLDILRAWKERVVGGFLERGCPVEDAEHLWGVLLEFAKYSFNKSHAAAYGLTGYIGQYLKVKYPIEFWTVAMDYANDVKALEYLSEIFAAKQIEVDSPDINKSQVHMTSSGDTIFYGIESVKGIGEKTAQQIIDVRGDEAYKDFDDFYNRNKFKGSAVKKQTYESLIACGAFDILSDLTGDTRNRNELLVYFRELHKVKAKDTDIYLSKNISKNWWWNLKQKELTNFAFFDYEDLISKTGMKAGYLLPIEQTQKITKRIRRSFGGYVIDFRERRISNGKYLKLTIENNYKIFTVMLWPETYSKYKSILKDPMHSIVLFEAFVQYEKKWTKGNQLTINPDDEVFVLKLK